MAAILACLKIHRFHTISYPRAPPSKTVSSRNNIPPLIGLLKKEGNVSDLHSSLLDKEGLTMIVGGSQNSVQIFKELPEGILVGGIKRGLLATAVKLKQK